MEVRRHHYVPQGYLRNFSIDGSGRQFIWAYDKRPGRVPRKKSVKSIAWADGYYSQEKPDGSIDYGTLEKALADIDTKSSELLARLPLRAWNEDSRGLLAYFIGLSITRVPSFRDGIRDMYSQLAQYTAEIVAPKIWNSDLPMPPLKAEAKEWVSLRHMIESSQLIADSLLKKEWHFYSSNENLFITSDNPVFFSGVAPANPSAEIYMPLRRDLAVIITPKHFGFDNFVTEVPAPVTKFLNGRIARAARHRLFCSYFSNGLDNLAKKHLNLEQKIAT